MKLKLIIGLLIAALAVVSLHAQVRMINQAEAVDENPLTAPITYFKVNGKIAYKFLGGLIPAQNVTVTAKNTQDETKVSSKTDDNGMYSLDIGQGEYIIRAQVLLKRMIFAPAYYQLFVTSDLSDINFVGILH